MSSSTQFQTDLQSLENDIAAWEALSGANGTAASDENAYEQALNANINTLNNLPQNVPSSQVNPQLSAAWVGMVNLLANQGYVVSSDKMSGTADAMKVLADLTACGNDLQALATNSSDTSSDSLQKFTSGLDQMLAMLDPNLSAANGGNATVNSQLTSILGKSTVQALTGYYTSLREAIDVTNSQGSVSAEDNYYNGLATTQYFGFDESNIQTPSATATYFTSFAAAYTAAQTASATSNATTALQKISDNLNNILTTTQNANTSTQATLTNEGNQLQAQLQFAASIMQDIIQLIQSANASPPK
ncbi:MAG: hypothetical protein KGI80_03970 [Verrucomicrobiota bacterium]|nr:hypothetical protein [Verrucomicrobiota bacterium]